MYVSYDKCWMYTIVDYLEFIEKELHKYYRTAPQSAPDTINTNQCKCVNKLQVGDRADPYNLRTLHPNLTNSKAYFLTKPSIKLIYSTKSGFERTTKNILDRFIPTVRETKCKTMVLYRRGNHLVFPA